MHLDWESSPTGLQTSHVVVRRVARTTGCFFALALALANAGCSTRSDDSSGDTIAGLSQATTFVQAKLSVPRGTQPQSVVLSATDRLILSDSSSIGKTGGTVQVANFGANGSELGSNAKLNGNLDSVSLVTLRSNATIFGKLRTTAATVSKQGGTRVLGGELKSVPLPSDVISWDVSFPSTDSGDIMLLNQQGKNDLSLAPGSYKSITTQPGTTLRLRAGTYYAATVTLESNAKLILDTSAGPIFFYISGTLIYRAGASMSVANGPQGNVLFGVFGSSEVFLESPFLGTMIVPSAKVTLRSSNGSPHKGQFFGKSVEVGANTAVELVAFDWTSTTVDSDCDGISDQVESSAGLNPKDPSDANSDRDNDGLSAREEAMLGGNPASADSDGDGTPDNPDLMAQTDFDGDGRVFSNDDCPNLVNPGQEDADGDGKGDVCDETPTGGATTSLRSLALYRSPAGDSTLAPQGFFDSHRIQNDLKGMYQTAVNVFGFALPLGTMTEVIEMWHPSGAHAAAISAAEKSTLELAGYEELGTLGYFSPTPLAFGKPAQIRRFAKTLDGRVTHAFAVSAANASALVAEGFTEIAALGYGLVDEGKLKHSSLVVRYRDAAGHYRYRESAQGEADFTGWTSDGNEFRTFERPTAWTVPLYRMVNTTGYEALVVDSELASFKAQGYLPKGILGYAYPATGVIQSMEAPRNLIRVTGSNKEPVYTTSSEEAQQLLASGYSASVVVARVVALNARDEFRQGKSCAGDKSIDTRVTEAVGDDDPNKAAREILLALGSACILQRIESGAPLTASEQAAKERLAKLDPQIVKVGVAAAKRLLELSPATRAALLGELAYFDPSECKSEVDLPVLMSAATDPEIRLFSNEGTTADLFRHSLVKLRAPQCQGVTYAADDRALPGEAARAITAVVDAQPPPTCTGGGDACHEPDPPKVGRIEPIVYAIKAGGIALPKGGANDLWQKAHSTKKTAANAAADVGVPLVGTHKGDCSSCSAALGESCVKRPGEAAECRSYPIVQNKTNVTISGANFWDLKTARVRITRLSTGELVEDTAIPASSINVYDDWESGLHRVGQCNFAPVPQQFDIGSPNPGGLPQDATCPPDSPVPCLIKPFNRDVLSDSEPYLETAKIAIELSHVGEFYSIQIVNMNGSYVPLGEHVPQTSTELKDVGHTVHVCAPPACSPGPSETAAACSLDTIPSCGGAVGGVWNTPPRSLTECDALHTANHSVHCPETPMSFESPTTAADGTPLRFYLAAEDPQYIQARLNKIQCNEETGWDDAGDDELVVSFTGVSLGELAIADMDENLTDVYKTDINHGDNLYPNTKFTSKRSGLLDAEPVPYMVQVGEDDDIGFAMIASAGVGAIVGAFSSSQSPMSAAAGAVGGGIGSFLAAYAAADTPGFDPDDFIGQTGWQTTSSDVAAKGVLAHTTPLSPIAKMTSLRVDRELTYREVGVHPAVDGVAYNDNNIVACSTNDQCNTALPVCYEGACVQSSWKDATRPRPFHAASDVPGIIEHIRMTGSETDYQFWISSSVTSTK